MKLHVGLWDSPMYQHFEDEFGSLSRVKDKKPKNSKFNFERKS